MIVLKSIRVLCLSIFVHGVCSAATYYVDANRADDTGNGRSWAAAKKTIQAAINAAVAGDEVLVTNGTYAPISTANKAITIRSVNGAQYTVIDGGNSNRCATLGSATNHFNTVLDGVTLQNGYSSSGGGSYCGTLNNCVLTGNTAASSYGGGAYRGTLNNCTLSGNTAYNGGGAYQGTLNNCIVWENSTPHGSNHYGCTFSYSCTAPLPSGAGNIAADPRLTDNYRLQSGSPCINAGNTKLVQCAVDMDGNAMIQNGQVNMGAFAGSVTEWLFTAQSELVTEVGGETVQLPVYAQDGSAWSASTTAEWITLTQASGTGDGVIIFDVQSNPGISRRSGSLVISDGVRTFTVAVTQSRYWYVSGAGNDSSGAGWDSAFRTIQTAVDAAMTGDEVMVTNGTYAPISTANKAVTIRSVNGAQHTVIDGGNSNRCATLGLANTHLDTVLDGFTLQNGHSRDGGGSYGGTLNNCTLSGNTAYYGGGTYYGTLNNCTLSENGASDGGGSYYGALNNCTLSGNTAYNGGGAHEGTLNNCIVWGNSAPNGSNYSSGTFSYSCTAPLPSGAGNIDTDPLFVNAENGDFRLRLESPCIDAGVNTHVVGDVDLIGSPRIHNNRVDMGAYEYCSYTIVFDGQGGTTSPENKRVARGFEYGELPAPARFGYIFDGWYTEPDGKGTFIVANSIVTADIAHTLYAYWLVVDTYTVIFDANGGSPASQAVTQIYGSNYVFPVVPVRNGYAFKGWFTSPADGEQVIAVTVMDTLPTIPFMHSGRLHCMLMQPVRMIAATAEAGQPLRKRFRRQWILLRMVMKLLWQTAPMPRFQQ